MSARSRRDFLHLTGIGVVAWGAGCAPAADPCDTDACATTETDAEVDTDAVVTTDTGAPAECDSTPRDQEGPFWIDGVPVRSELDLYGEEGPQLTLSGTVRDSATCEPIAAVVEIWHADPNGVYDNASPEMRYRGQTATAAYGAYRFHTKVPGRYAPRPLHIHMKVWVGGIERLTTQIYFPGDPDNDGVDPDLIAEIGCSAPDLSATFDVVV